MKSLLPHLILSTAGFSEICDWRQLSINWTATEPTVIQIIDGSLCIFLSSKFYVYIADQMISQIVAYIHLLDLPILILTLNKNIFKEVVIMFLHFFIRHIRNHFVRKEVNLNDSFKYLYMFQL